MNCGVNHGWVCVGVEKSVECVLWVLTGMNNCGVIARKWPKIARCTHCTVQGDTKVHVMFALWIVVLKVLVCGG